MDALTDGALLGNSSVRCNNLRATAARPSAEKDPASPHSVGARIGTPLLSGQCTPLALASVADGNSPKVAL